MAHRPRPECAPKRQRFPKPKPARDPIAAIACIDPDLSPTIACVAIVSRTRKVFRQQRRAAS